MNAGGLGRDQQLGPDLTVAPTGRDKLKHVQLASCEIGHSRGAEWSFRNILSDAGAVAERSDLREQRLGTKGAGHIR